MSDPIVLRISEHPGPVWQAAQRRYAQLKAIQDAEDEWRDNAVAYTTALIPKVRELVMKGEIHNPGDGNVHMTKAIEAECPVDSLFQGGPLKERPMAEWDQDGLSWQERTQAELQAEYYGPPSLSFADLREANASRVGRWHGPDSEPWTGSDWSNAMAGECGEACNVVKKLRRSETGTANQGDPDPETLRQMLADEIADTVIYADLLAKHYGIDVAEAVAHKFDRTSIKMGFPERLGGRESSDDT